ncbi:hypothetical protein [Ruicaihuangia caeni]|uniref:Uncharacterized protein n=1 Tax=Ruicaihuangia caeni TaxID=3042517 RepID=A0AAW6T6T4_9MICO|nr:hypothetical protein [Klugiella sp. YN-L-19]MDI2097810.1 hypothetical protein [Klugiella sp. YN-L-19]
MSVTVSQALRRRRSRTDRLASSVGRTMIRWGAALAARSLPNASQHERAIVRERTLLAHERRVDQLRGPGIRA